MKKIVNVKVFDEGVDITYREHSHQMYATNPPRPVPDTVWMEQWRVIGETLQLAKTITGKHIPAHFKEERFELFEEERFEFNEE